MGAWHGSIFDLCIWATRKHEKHERYKRHKKQRKINFRDYYHQRYNKHLLVDAWVSTWPTSDFWKIAFSWRRGDLPRHRYAGPRSAGRREPSSGDLELTCQNNRRFLPSHTIFSTSISLQALAKLFTTLLQASLSYCAPVSRAIPHS